MIQSVATLHVELTNIIANWRMLEACHHGQTGAVVKANAYGLGVAPVAQALARHGCTIFFVATLEEAITLRAALPEVTIYVFQGLLRGEADVYIAHRLRPIINTLQQLQDWAPIEAATTLPAALHIDTGMQRLGLDRALMNDAEIIRRIQSAPLDMLMTHYACASDLNHPMNAQQLARIQHVQRLLPHLRTSYGNSAAHFLPPAYHGDITRPGCALYGIQATNQLTAIMRPVVRLSARILQIRTIMQDDTLGYGATTPVTRGMRVATVGIGYADGIDRSASHRLYGYIGAWRVPLLGRVTMDALCFDVSDLPASVLEAEQYITLMDQRQTVDDLARIYGTIGYEVLSSLGQRIQRVYD
ncbi:MAG: alanine racemase [Sphaerospermopsis sp. SIO1G2]|nr:alanine racemase [Sphaerospermopsis sp. SIO1G2]